MVIFIREGVADFSYVSATVVTVGVTRVIEAMRYYANISATFYITGVITSVGIIVCGSACFITSGCVAQLVAIVIVLVLNVAYRTAFVTVFVANVIVLMCGGSCCCTYVTVGITIVIVNVCDVAGKSTSGDVTYLITSVIKYVRLSYVVTACFVTVCITVIIE